MAYVVATAEALVRNWSADALRSGLEQHEIVTTILLQDAVVGFLDSLDQHFLPEVLILRFPHNAFKVSFLGSEVSLGAEILAASKLHCPAVPRQGAALRTPSMKLVARSLTAAVSRSNSLRCTSAIRLPTTRKNPMSNFVRGRKEVHCGLKISSLLWQFRKALEVSRVGERMYFVEVGAGFGDCMLSAAAIIPNGRLRGIAFEAHPVLAAAMRDTMWINGLSSLESNESSVEVRHMALSNTSKGRVKAYTEIDEVQWIRASTLDAELALGHPYIDLLTVFVNHFYLAVLQGAERILRAGLALCLAILRGYPGVIEDNPGLNSFLIGVGYRNCGGSFWSPEGEGSCQRCCPHWALSATEQMCGDTE